MRKVRVRLTLVCLTLMVSAPTWPQAVGSSKGGCSATSVQSVVHIVQWISNQDDVKIAATSLGQIGDLVWKCDEGYARNLFALALSKLATTDTPTAKDLSAKRLVQRKIVSLIAKHDPTWANRILESQGAEVEKQSRARLDVANDLIETDTKRAIDFARQSIDAGVVEGVTWFLHELRLRDPEAANQLFLQAVARYAQQPDVTSYSYAFLGSYLFAPNPQQPGAAVISISRIGNFGMPDLMGSAANIPLSLMRPYLSGAILVISRPGISGDEAERAYALGYMLRPKVREFSPSMVPALDGAMAALIGRIAPEIASESAYDRLRKQAVGSARDRLDEIEKLPDERLRDQLYLEFGYTQWQKNNFPLAELAASRIADVKIRAELEKVIRFGQLKLQLDLKNADLSLVQADIAKLPVSLERSLLELGVAAAALKAKNQVLAKDAAFDAVKTTRALGSESAPFILLYVSGFLRPLDKIDSEGRLYEAIQTFNKVDSVNIPVLANEIRLEPVSFSFPLRVPGLNLDFGTSFGRAVQGNEDAAILMVRDLKDEKLKSQAYVSLVKLLLAREISAATGLQERVVLVGEDGIRRSVKKLVMPLYPNESIKKKKSGVCVSEIQFNGEGNVTNVKILQSPDPSIGDAVARAMKESKFVPSQLEGAPISIRGKITFYFVIDAKGKGKVLNPKQFR